jgi:hypothetical protein
MARRDLTSTGSHQGGTKRSTIGRREVWKPLSLRGNAPLKALSLSRNRRLSL